MILEITQHDHPALRTKGRRVDKLDENFHRLVADMIETMREAGGIGLAAQQVGLPLQLFVLEVPQMKDRPSAMRIAGKNVDFEALMPLVVVNPTITMRGSVRLEGEGCLSFPGLRGDVPRPLSVRVEATGADGSPLEFEADGLLARAIQHEYDHLQGILFIDRMSPEDRVEELPQEILRLARDVA